MKGRLWWSSVLPLAATLCLTFATPTVVRAQSGPKLVGTGPEGPFEYSPRSAARRPGLINPLCGTVGGPAVASSDCDSQSGREWEGIASTDYFTVEPTVYSPPNPDVAVGPDDILTVVNRTIARYPNPNAPAYNNGGGTASVNYDVAGAYLFSPSSRQFLDVWLGEAALNELCPTTPRSNASCEIGNASVRYDQMQGRFVVLFTVVDTGLVSCSGCSGVPTQTTSPLRRKASWVLIASKWATGCQGAVTSTGGFIGTGCTPNTTPAVNGLIGNTTFFTTPQPPGASQANPNSGGINGNWVSYYGIPDNSCEPGCPYGNINSISDVRNGGSFQGARVIDCNNTAVGDTTRVCYFPSSARLGLDNDNIVVSSSVYNDNIPLANRGYTSGQNGLLPAWEGTRTRVYKKAAIYTGTTSTPGCAAPLCPGASQLNPQIQGDFYDLFDTGSPYTFDRVVTRDVGGVTQSMLGLNYEPEHVRGRSLASYSGNGNLDGGYSALWGAVDQGYTATNAANPPQTLLYHRSIIYTRTVAGTIGANVGSVPATVNTPAIVGGIPRLGTLQSHTVPQFTNPDDVTQRDKLVQPSPNNQLPTPYLYVGDDRPHRVIAREGERYIARVGSVQGFRFDSTNNYSTVIYDIVQKLSSTATATEVYNTTWGNGRYYAPMFDTPANVVQYGSVSPINVQPFLEKLFVGTTFPPLAPSDPRTFNYGGIAGQALLACKGQEPSVSTSVSAYPGLFDIRCGEDAYDTAQAYRHPVTGAFTPTDFQVDAQPSGFPNQIVPMGIRGGAATDPNNMGLWLYGSYAKGRLASIPGYGQWGTYVAHYPLTFPLRDPYNNSIASYTDVQPGNPFFTYIQIAKQTEIQPGSRTDATFNPTGTVSRAEMARWTIRAQMDENGVTAYLNSTGGIFCSFADVACPGVSGAATNSTGISGDWRYIETMYRRGYTKGCEATNDGQRRFCPTRTLTRGEMAVFIIRAKMNAVFPTVTSGAFTTTSCQPAGTQVTNVGDQYGLFAGCSPYFSDVPNTHIFYSFIQKMRELRISNGTTYSTPAALGTFSPDGTLTRQELMTFLVRAFFP
ncbi:MAG: S-layer homology domain-containing protein [Bryobacterales bacterium]|nr:S-layer homology domain-containing protein [Bryobacterales bacterium]